MTFRTCSFENELTQALKDGHWPEGCGPELRAHVETCGELQRSRAGDADVPDVRGVNRNAQRFRGSPSLLWWRAQLRRRNAATERVSRPVTIAQIFALVVYVIRGRGFCCIAVPPWSAVGVVVGGDRASARAFIFCQPDLDKSIWNLLLLISGFGVLAIVSVLVVYLASEKS